MPVKVLEISVVIRGLDALPEISLPTPALQIDFSEGEAKIVQQGDDFCLLRDGLIAASAIQVVEAAPQGARLSMTVRNRMRIHFPVEGMAVRFFEVLGIQFPSGAFRNAAESGDFPEARFNTRVKGWKVEVHIQGTTQKGYLAEGVFHLPEAPAKSSAEAVAALGKAFSNWLDDLRAFGFTP